MGGQWQGAAVSFDGRVETAWGREYGMSRSALNGRTSESLPDLRWLDNEGQSGRRVDRPMQTSFHTRFLLQSARSPLRQSPASLQGTAGLWYGPIVVGAAKQAPKA